MRTCLLTPPLALALIALAACGEPTRTVTPAGNSLPRFGVVAPLSLGEEEIIPDTVYGTNTFYAHFGSQDHALYNLCGGGGGCMYYNPHASLNHWGYFTNKNADCTSWEEAHDIDGDGIEDRGQPERHCIPNGAYDLSVWRRYYSAEHLDSTRTIFRRRVAMLDTLGFLGDVPGSREYHDVHVPFDLDSATPTLAGDIRAGHEYRQIDDTTDYYPLDVDHTVGSGDELWLISTHLASGSAGRPWYNSYTGLLTAFNTDYEQYPSDFGGAVNSVPTPQTLTKPFLHVFTGPPGSTTFRVVGRVIAPNDNGMSRLGTDRTAQSLWVTVVAAHACFTYSGSLQPGQPVSFDAGCSSGFTALEYSWNFGDNSPATPWSTSADTTHTFTSPGNYSVLLSLRRQGRPSDADDTTRTVTIAPGLTVWITGPDQINTSGNYTWDAQASGGQTPYHYQWYYKQGGTETPVGADSPSYTRYVAVGKTPYTFRLRNVVTDAAQQTAQRIYWVEVLPGGGGLASVGALDASGACAPLPTVRAQRQAALTAIAASGRWPTPCRLSQP